MKVCKVIVCFLFAASFAVGNVKTVSAEEWKEMPTKFDYESCMERAKNYEKNKSWIWALDEYYNAINSSRKGQELETAFNAYSELAGMIESGMPGRGEFDKFSLYESWKNLLIETEQYGNRVFPYELYFGSFQTIKLNLENKTADYSVRLAFTRSTRYLKTVGVVSKGYAKARQDSWTELPKEFPGRPVSDDTFSVENYGKKTSAFAYSYDSSNVTDCKNVIPYEAVFEIVSDDGIVFAESQPYVLGDKTAKEEYSFTDYSGPDFTFNNVPSEGIKAIDAGKAYIRLKHLCLMYGDLNSNYFFRGRRNFTGGNRIGVFIYLGNLHSDNKTTLADCAFCADGSLAEFEPMVTVSGKKVHCVFFDTRKLFGVVFGDENLSLKSLWHESFLDYVAYVFCNELSKNMFRQPVYEKNCSTALCDFLVGEDWAKDDKTIKKNPSANGYRMPTLEEVRKFLAHSGDKSFPQVEDKGSVFTGEAYNYCTIDKQFVKGAYLMLYYLE